MKPARPSLASVLLRPRFGNIALGTATGFLVKFIDSVYLITNWHVVAGRRADTGAVLHEETGAVPDRLEVVLLTSQEPPAWEPVVEPLFDDENDEPLWLVHPRIDGRRVDVVALPLTHRGSYTPLGHDPFTGSRIDVAVSDQVSIIGFPHGETGGAHFAVWMQGTVASEPEADHRDLPVFLVDSRTRPGMSGSPVIAYTHGGVRRNADGSATLGGPPVESFLGVYSGRINPDSDLGTVWKAEVVRKILELKNKDQARGF